MCVCVGAYASCPTAVSQGVGVGGVRVARDVTRERGRGRRSTRFVPAPTIAARDLGCSRVVRRAERSWRPCSSRCPAQWCTVQASHAVYLHRSHTSIAMATSSDVRWRPCVCVRLAAASCFPPQLLERSPAAVARRAVRAGALQAGWVGASKCVGSPCWIGVGC